MSTGNILPTDLEVVNNTAMENTYGIVLIGTTDALVLGNNVSNNTVYGIALQYSHGSNITDSNSTINGLDGAIISLSENVTIDPSYFCNNTGSGINLNASNNTLIDDSVACNNTQHGILINNSLDTMINYSNIYNNSQHGVYSLNSNNSNFTGSNITGNSVDGVLFDATSSNTDLYSNYVCFNGFDVNNQGASNNGTLDSCDTFASWIEDGHLGCEFACSSFWHRFFGDTNGTILLTDNVATQYFYTWNASGFMVYFTDYDSSIDWASLQAIGRTSTSTQSSNDFTELDTAFNGTTYDDNINATYSTDGSLPIETRSYTVFQNPIANVPVANSTKQNTTFQTGILWDTNDGGTEYSNTLNQSTVWVVEVNASTVDAYGTYDYLVQVPYTLSDYEGSTSLVSVYLELQ